MKKFLLSTLTILALPVMAQTFEYEGIIYDVYDAGFRTCITGAGDDTVNLIDGDLVIPETVMYNNEEYVVIGIGQCSFYYADEYYKQPWTLTLPNSIIFIDSYAFMHCEYLTHVYLSEYLNSIGYSGFSHCFSLGNVNFPASLTTVADWAFYANHSMTEIILPPYLTSTGVYAFCGPKGGNDVYLGGIVEKIYIPEGTDELNQRAFGYQPELKAVYCYATTPPVLTSAPFNHSSSEFSDLYVPAASVDTYKSDDSWVKWQWVTVNPITEEYPWVWEGNPGNTDDPDAGVDFTFDENAPATYFDMQGRSVNAGNLQPGIYVVRQGNKSFKKIVR